MKSRCFRASCCCLLQNPHLVPQCVSRPHRIPDTECPLTCLWHYLLIPSPHLRRKTRRVLNTSTASVSDSARQTVSGGIGALRQGKFSFGRSEWHWHGHIFFTLQLLKGGKRVKNGTFCKRHCVSHIYNILELFKNESFSDIFWT